MVVKLGTGKTLVSKSVRQMSVSGVGEWWAWSASREHGRAPTQPHPLDTLDGERVAGALPDELALQLRERRHDDGHRLPGRGSGVHPVLLPLPRCSGRAAPGLAARASSSASPCTGPSEVTIWVTIHLD